MTDETPKRRPRRIVTIETHLQRYDALLKYLDGEIDHKSRHKEKGVQTLKTVRKNIREMKKEVPRISRRRRLTPAQKARKSGFSVKCKVSDELAEFMQIPPGSTPTRLEVTNAIYTYINLKEDEKRPQMLKWQHLNPDRRNLQNPENKMAILPDEKLSKLLRYDEYCQNVADGKVTKKVLNKQTYEKDEVVMTDNSLFYWVIQRLIQHHITKC